tara:strand:+ start:984 stop:1262 length:279 start_codon:yes stop_codon:yes gene_type:complete
MKGIYTTLKEIEVIHGYLLEGYTAREVAKKAKCSISTVYKHKRYVEKIKSVILGYKDEPYYENEDDYCRVPKEVTYEDLSEKEKNIYNNGKI